VLLTREPHSAAPYFVISEDRLSGRSDVVTSGKGGHLEQRFVAWSAVEPGNMGSDTRRLLDLGKELIDLSRLDALDIEYAVDSAGECHLLQARPLAAAQHVPAVADEDVLDLLAGVSNFVAERMRPLPGLSGSSTIFGVMPDWNPAEMIGVAPRPLALSLYQTLIGDESWAEARFRLGYRDTRPERLILSLGGRPYVDVRASLNSFLPSSLEAETAARWVDACLERLRRNPALHDKIEFDIAVTCLAPDWDAVSSRIADVGLDPLPMQTSLRQLTQPMLSGAIEPISRQEAQLEHLAERRMRLLSAPRAGIHDTARVVGQLLNDCRRYGIVPFSILARYAFVSMTFLRGLVRVGAIDEQDYQACLVGIPTVAGRVADDLRKGLPVDVLIAEYGHLRPNSYEITSPNYASIPGQFLRAPAGRSEPAGADFATILRRKAPAIAATLKELALDIDSQQLFTFIAGSIAGRERAKFEFTKNLDAALELCADLGARLGLDREATSFLEIADLLHLEAHSLTQADKTQLRRRSAFSEKRWMATRAIRLPDVIRSPEEVLSFRLEAWKANFITRKRVAGRALWLDDAGSPQDLTGAIVITRAADPGYDWIFAHGIAGLVTEYGGLGSHMSIRAAEFGLPAAIGCGGVIIDSLRGAEAVELDCAAERVRRVP
jgi:hypothetical protein